MASEIVSIQFGILGDDDIVKMSACIVDKPSFAIETGSVYDPRMGCVQNESVCETCSGTIWTCPGHFGHIELNTPIILFHKQCVNILKTVCLQCCRLKLRECELKLAKICGYDNVLNALSEVSLCSHCKTPAPDVRLSAADATIFAHHKHKNTKTSKELTPAFIKMVLDAIPEEDVLLFGIDSTMVHPKNLVLTKFPVVPTCCRPRMFTCDNVSDDDLTLMLIDILKSNKYIFEHPCDDIVKDLSKIELDKKAAYDKALATIKYRAISYCDNSKGRATHNTNHKALVGIKDRINKKTGIVRQNLTGKRCDRTARTVIGPDPTLKLDQVALPIEIATTLTIPEYVNQLNIERLTTIVNLGKASTIIRRETNQKINVAHARKTRGTVLSHGDIIMRDGREMVVTNCREKLLLSDKIKKLDGSVVNATLPRDRPICLAIGDKVERYLIDGDPIYLNRQPTLHRNSMLGMRVVVKPGKTTRFNLAITKGLNADFDGDEGNLFGIETLESAAELLYLVNAKEHMLSAQTNKPEMVIVQDSLLAAYLMTNEPQEISRADFCNCLMKTSALATFDFRERLPSDRSNLYSHDLFAYILPRDFSVTYPAPSCLTIKGGRIISGYFSKASLSCSANAIVRLLCMDYGSEIAASFIDNLQFLTNAWLEINPFSIGIADCVIGNEEKLAEIKQTTFKYFLEADAVAKSTNDKRVREARVNLALNKAKDIGLKIAKDALKPTNNCISTVMSGSKGDFFNIAQITGLLGQQNLSNERPKPTLSNGTRTMIHYPPIITDVERKYESRGFVASSFIGGLNPKEMWFHAMTGREGMINTAMKTATSGYIQRSCVKLSEDLKVEYDGTVRDANKNIYQFAYGNHGYDPCNVTFKRDGSVCPVDFDRLCLRLNFGCKKYRKLTDDEISRIIKLCAWKSSIPTEIYESIWEKHERHLESELKRVVLNPDRYQEFERVVIAKYHTARAVPGECVGIIGAQSIGELQTQSNLNTFHTAGKLQISGVDRFEEILNMTKTVKTPTMTIYFKDRYTDPDKLRNKVGHSLVGLTLGKVMAGYEPYRLDTIGTDYKLILRYRLKRSVLYENRLSPSTICEAISQTYCDCDCDCEFMAIIVKLKHDNSSKSESIKDSRLFSTDDFARITKDLENVLVCGIEGICAMYLDKSDNDEFYVVTEGTNLKKVLAHPLVDITRIYTNDTWEMYECLGISATRTMLLQDVKKAVAGVNDVHIQLLVDKMTSKGKPMSFTRYTMRTNDVGPLSKSTFEQSVDVLLTAAFRGEIDNINGVSAAIVSGTRAKIGTGLPEILIDYESIIGDAYEPPETYY
jgi:DNA-directed RNA polymerase beta' subunit